MTSPYPTLVPLAVAIPRMLAEVETQLADETAGASDNWRLRQRAELIRSLLAPTREGLLAAIESGAR